MMDDQLEQYIEYLKEEGYSDCNIVDGYIFIKLKIENKDIVLKCNLDSPFPYKFPSIYIVRDRSDEIEAIPHKNGDDSLCLYDTGKAIPNFFEPQRLLLESIQKAERNICVGIKGENQYDFITEFTAYWKSKIVKADSFLNDESKTKQIVWLMRASNTINAIIAESEEQLRHITSMIWKEKDSKGNVHEALCVSLDGSKITEIPENDVQVIRMIMSSAYDAKCYQSFMQKNLEKIKLIIMKIYMPNGIMTIGWVHLAAQQQHGFRKGKANITLAYSNKQTDVGFPIQINDCSQSRLYNRGSDGQPAKWDSVAILGCGSVGSAVAELMMRLGTTDYLLVDNEYLSAENVARHYCGYDLIGLRKTRSIQFMLCHHNPNISCQCLNDDIHYILDHEVKQFENYGIIVVAVANLSVEHHIVEYVNKGIIKQPVIILWMEPYGMGGHALLVNKKQDLYEELFSKKDLQFQYGIVKNPERYLKREAGCESSYMPYSGFAVSLFAHSIFEYIQSEKISSEQNVLITWIGKISNASNYDISISTKYEDKKDFEIIKRRVD